MSTQNSMLEQETPGNPNMKEEIDDFNHKYFVRSMKIIDLILLGKENLISAQNLLTEIDIKNVFFEEPIDEEFLNKSRFSNGSQREIEVVKMQQRRKFIELKKAGNDTEQLYLIDANWVRRWINYVNYSSANFPGSIINDQLYMQLDQLGGILLGQDAFFISRQLWECLFSWYGGGPVLKWKIEIDDHKPSSVSSTPQQIKPDSKVDYRTGFSQNDRKMSEDSDLVGTIREMRNHIKQLNEDPNTINNDVYINKKSQNFTKIISETSHNFQSRQSYQYLQQQTEYDLLRLFGIENNSLYCYLNSVLQCIFAIKQFRDYYERQAYKMVRVNKPQSPDYKFSKLMEDFSYDFNKICQKPGQKIVKTKYIRQAIEKEFSPIMEHDSHEFLLYFLNKLKEEITEKQAKLPSDSKDSISRIWKLFSDQFPSQIDRLFTVIEKANIVCNYCGKQLQRFSTYPKMRKIRGLIKYGEFLDMAQFMRDEDLEASCNKQTEFELISVAVHMGTIQGGHYVAYAKKEDNHWYYMNDERVSRVQQQHQPNQTKLICSSSFLTPGYDQDYDDVLNVGLQSLDNQNDNEFFAEDSLEYEKRARQKEFSLKMANYMKEQETPGQDFPTGMNNDDSINCEVEIDQIKQNQMAPLQIQDVQDQLGHIYTHPQQYRDIQFDVDSNLDFQSNSGELFVNQSESYYNNADILNQSVIFGFSNFQNDHYDEMMMNNISFQNNSDYIFEQMQPQQLDHETIIKGENLERFYNITNEELNSQQKQVIELDLQEQQVSEKLSKGQQRKKRGAPFKGQVSDQKEEGFKYQRQQIFRDFNRHYNKISGNFNLIRDPMYKYRKDVKEQLFKDNSMSFLWMYYRFYGEFETPSNTESYEIQSQIYEQFDKHALQTLTAGNVILFSYIFQLFQVQEKDQTPAGDQTQVINPRSRGESQAEMGDVRTIGDSTDAHFTDEVEINSTYNHYDN
eukprot:403346820